MDNAFAVEVLISNKVQARDPEGEVILNDLIHKEGYGSVTEVRTGKLLILKVEAQDEAHAKDLVFRLCNELRLYNPVAHAIRIEVRGKR